MGTLYVWYDYLKIIGQKLLQACLGQTKVAEACEFTSTSYKFIITISIFNKGYQ